MEFKGLPKPEIKEIKIVEIAPNDYNPQELSNDIFKGLVKHIQARGFTAPINVRPLDKEGGDPQSQPWIIVDGEHRLGAFMEAFPGETEITCAVIKGKDGKHITRQEALVSTIAYNYLHGEENPVKMATAIKLILEGGMLIEDIEELTSMNRSKIKAFLEFDEVPPAESEKDGFTGAGEGGPELKEPIIVSFAVYPEDKGIIDKALDHVKPRLAPEIDIDEEKGKCLLLLAQVALGLDSEPHAPGEKEEQAEVSESPPVTGKEENGKAGQGKEGGNGDEFRWSGY